MTSLSPLRTTIGPCVRPSTLTSTTARGFITPDAPSARFHHLVVSLACRVTANQDGLQESRPHVRLRYLHPRRTIPPILRCLRTQTDSGQTVNKPLFCCPDERMTISDERHNDYAGPGFKDRPFLGALLFDNVSSDARDHAANERSKHFVH